MNILDRRRAKLDRARAHQPADPRLDAAREDTTSEPCRLRPKISVARSLLDASKQMH